MRLSVVRKIFIGFGLLLVVLAVLWQATRSIRAGCDLMSRHRPSDRGIGAFTANIFGCFGEITLR